jgi:hypothetical protein
VNSKLSSNPTREKSRGDSKPCSRAALRKPKALLVLEELFQFPSPERPTLFRGYGTGVNDPLWRGVPFDSLF